METRLEKLFLNKPLDHLSVFVTAGFPHKNSLLEIIPLLHESDCDLIEIGIPYSDPLADGTIIQNSSSVALKNGMNLNLILQQVKEVRAKTQKPIILMGYLNSVLKFGIEKFYLTCHDVGVDGLIIPDLPLHEYKQMHEPFIKRYKHNFSFLITPETEYERALELASCSSGFVYLVSSNATTGSSKAMNSNLTSFIDTLKRNGLKIPILIGFGIKNSADFQKCSAISNGAIIGSAFIQLLGSSLDLKKDIPYFIHSIKTKTHDHSIN